MMPQNQLVIGVTGSEGLLGYHLRAYLHPAKDIEVRCANRQTFASAEALRAFVQGCDAIVHYAGMNRGDDAEIERVNVALTEALIAACESVEAIPHIVFSSSAHIDRDTAYARSKRKCTSLLQAWAERSSAPFTNLVLSHVFGEFGKPFYNSVVATFCHQLAKGEVPVVTGDGELELLHAQTVAALVTKAIRDRQTGDFRPAGRKIKVSGVLSRLQAMAAAYREGGVLPDVSDELDMRLFNVYRSWLFPQLYPRPLTCHADARGSFFEMTRGRSQSQTSFSTTHPGITRGNHYHTRKIERFVVTSGDAVIRLRRLFGDEVVEFPVSGKEPCYVDMPTFHTHNITNVGSSELTTFFWINELYDPEDPDTFIEPVTPSWKK